MELDDGHRFGMLHLGAVIIPAVLALGQQERISLDRILHGIVVGYEAAARLAVSMQPGHKKAGYHTTGTCGTIGAALGCAAALSMDRMQMKAVLSAAASSAAGLLEIQENASQLKAYNAGQAAMAGAGAVLIGKCRLKGPDDILGGDRGFLRIHSATVSEETLVKRDTPLEIERIYVKPYAACRHCHSAMEAAMQLRSRLQTGAEEIEEILIDTYQLAIRGHDHREIKGVESAKLSIPYSVAAAYILNSGSLDAFSESSVNQAEILMLARKVKVRENPEFTALAPGKRIAEVRVVTVAGHLARARVEYAKGDPENPMTEDELKDKFMGLMQYCGREEQAKALLECLLRQP